MGNIISAIYDDMDDYERLCEKYSEKVKYSPDAYGNMLVDCYGKHARDLQERTRLEYEQERKAKTNTNGR